MVIWNVAMATQMEETLFSGLESTAKGNIGRLKQDDQDLIRGFRSDQYAFSPLHGHEQTWRQQRFPPLK